MKHPGKLLSERNKEFKIVYEKFGEIPFEKRELNLSSIVKIIINQQLSGRAADTIFSRLIMFTRTEELSPEIVLSIGDETWSNLGVSTSKVSYIRTFAKTLDHNRYIFEEWWRLNDDEVQQEIQKIRGLGPWSSNIIMLFYMGREDVFPRGDVSLERAYGQLFGIKLDPKRPATYLHTKWASPYRSTLCLYLWKCVDSGLIKRDNQR